MLQSYLYLLIINYSILVVQGLNVTYQNILSNDQLLPVRPFVQIGNYSQLNYWPSISPNRYIAGVTQRDVSINDTLPLNVVTGVDLTQVIFKPQNYNVSSLNDVFNILDVGANALTIDLYYNEVFEDWNLCPSSLFKQYLSNDTRNDFCDISKLNMGTLLARINTFIVDTNNQYNTEILYLFFKLHTMNVKNLEAKTGIDNISDQLSIFSSNLIVPGLIDTDELPTLNEILHSMKKSVLPIVIESDFHSNETLSLMNKEPLLFFGDELEANLSGQSNVVEISYDFFEDVDCTVNSIDENKNLFQFAYDTPNQPFNISTYWKSIQCGYSPVISQSFSNITEITYFFETSFWSWAPFQPTVSNFDSMSSTEFKNILSTLKKTKSDTPIKIVIQPSDNDGDDDPFVNRCAVATLAGWIATSCKQKFRTLCRSKSNLDYKLSQDYSDYMSASGKCDDLDGDYVITVPTNSLESRYITKMIPADELGIWIDVNSLSTKSCWVVGADTECPYQVVISKKIFSEMISYTSVVSFVLLCIIVAFQFDYQPVHKNRKYWRRELKKINDIDGTPN